jgi:hypothetical protein
MTCSSCSSENPKGANFCLKCGNQIVDSAPAESSADQVATIDQSDDSKPKPGIDNIPLLTFSGFVIILTLLMFMPKGPLGKSSAPPTPSPTPIVTTSADRLASAQNLATQAYDADRYQIAISHLDAIFTSDKEYEEGRRLKEKLTAQLRKRGDLKPIETPSPEYKAATIPTSDPIAELLAFIRTVDKNGDLIINVTQGVDSNTAKITVANQWHDSGYQVRLQNAQLMWKSWAGFRSPKEPDKARIKILDRMGNEVGGSRIWGGSLIWVKD